MRSRLRTMPEPAECSSVAGRRWPILAWDATTDGTLAPGAAIQEAAEPLVVGGGCDDVAFDVASAGDE